MPKIFISYRREDSADVAGRINDRLVASFGQTSVFKDVDSIPLGADFRKHLERAVVQCDVVLVIIGEKWLGASGADGARRIDGARDFVRLEVEAALQRDIPVIPVLVRGAPAPAERDLPPSLQDLCYRQASPVRQDPDFHKDMDRLIKALEQLGEATAAKPADVEPPPLQAPDPSIRSRSPSPVAAAPPDAPSPAPTEPRPRSNSERVGSGVETAAPTASSDSLARQAGWTMLERFELLAEATVLLISCWLAVVACFCLGIIFAIIFSFESTTVPIILAVGGLALFLWYYARESLSGRLRKGLAEAPSWRRWLRCWPVLFPAGTFLGLLAVPEWALLAGLIGLQTAALIGVLWMRSKGQGSRTDAAPAPAMARIRW